MASGLLATQLPELDLGVLFEVLVETQEDSIYVPDHWDGQTACVYKCMKCGGTAGNSCVLYWNFLPDHSAWFLECVCSVSSGRHSVCVLVTSVITNCLPDYRMCVQVLALFVFYTVLLALYVNKIQCRGSFFCLFGSC